MRSRRSRDALDRDLGDALFPPVHGRVEIADARDAGMHADELALGIAHEQVVAARAGNERSELVVPLAACSER
jgi:hypothetical protein